MRARTALLVLTVAAFFPRFGTAQVFNLPEAPPQVTAEHALWQVQGEPVFYAGDFYYPTGPTRYFDPNVMVRAGMYQGVPFYVDGTEAPYSVVYVPIGSNVMRPYERVREGVVAGTVGSRTPSFPVTPGPDQTTTLPPVVIPETARAAVAQAAAPVGAAPTASDVTGTSGVLALPGRIDSIPPPRTNGGIWIEYKGERWYSAGAAITVSPDRFTPVGDYHGFPVFRDNSGDPDVIYVATVAGGLAAPFKKR